MPSVVPPILSLGSKALYEVLLGDVFRKGGSHRVEDVRAYCVACRYRVAAQIEGALQLLLNIGALVAENKLLHPDPDILLIAESEGIGPAICGRLLNRLAVGGEIDNYFPPGSVSWGMVEGEINLHLCSVPTVALPVVKLLRDLEVAVDSEEAAVLLKVHEPFAAILRSSILTGIGRRRRTSTLTPERLAMMQDENEKQGAEAESYVLDIEITRLKGHPQLELVRRISLSDTSAGYDIESFEGPKSLMPDRFIEVKSHKSQERFFISIGELNAARELGERYFLCLVDMGQIGSQDYAPIFIQNPAARLFGSNSDWLANPVNFEVIRKESFGPQM